MKNLSEEMREVLRERGRALKAVKGGVAMIKVYEGSAEGLARQLVECQKTIIILTQQVIDLLLESGREI